MVPVKASLKRNNVALNSSPQMLIENDTSGPIAGGCDWLEGRFFYREEIPKVFGSVICPPHLLMAGNIDKNMAQAAPRQVAHSTPVRLLNHHCFLQHESKVGRRLRGSPAHLPWRPNAEKRLKRNRCRLITGAHQATISSSSTAVFIVFVEILP